MRPSNILALVYGRPSNWLRFSLDGQNLCESSIQQLDKHSATVTLYIAALHNPAPNISLPVALSSSCYITALTADTDGEATSALSFLSVVGRWADVSARNLLRPAFYGALRWRGI